MTPICNLKIGFEKRCVNSFNKYNSEVKIALEYALPGNHSVRQIIIIYYICKALYNALL